MSLWNSWPWTFPSSWKRPAGEKAQTLLQIIGVGPRLADLERQEKELYNERTYIGRTADQKEKYAKEQPIIRKSRPSLYPLPN